LFVFQQTAKSRFLGPPKGAASERQLATKDENHRHQQIPRLGRIRRPRNDNERRENSRLTSACAARARQANSFAGPSAELASRSSAAVAFAVAVGFAVAVAVAVAVGFAVAVALPFVVILSGARCGYRAKPKDLLLFVFQQTAKSRFLGPLKGATSE
jgi:hypothetical protein